MTGNVVERPNRYQWVTEDGTRWILTDIPTSPCHECGAEIPDEHHCYFRDGPAADNGFDHVCWDCGDEVTGFAG